MGLLVVGALALVSRAVWVLLLHPPQDSLFSDMRGYALRAEALARHGEVLSGPTPTLYPPGTHGLLAAGWWLGGAQGAGLLWAILGACVPVLGWRLGERLGSRPWMGAALGSALLLWPPHVSHAGYFLSETPFLLLTLAGTLALLRVVETGRGSWWAGLVLAAAFLVRPQIAISAVLAVFVLSWRQAARVVLPGALAALVCMSVNQQAAGSWQVAANSSLNRALAVCAAGRLEVRSGPNDARPGRLLHWLEPPPFLDRLQHVPFEDPLAVRPALGQRVVQVVGEVTDSKLHGRLATRCLGALSPLERMRAAGVRGALLWLGERPWPEAFEPAASLPWVQGAHRLARGLLLPLAGVGLLRAGRHLRQRRGLWLVVAHLVGLLVVSTWYFGSLRLRAWADPYLMLLALEGAAALGAGARALRRGPRSGHRVAAVEDDGLSGDKAALM